MTRAAVWSRMRGVAVALILTSAVSCDDEVEAGKGTAPGATLPPAPASVVPSPSRATVRLVPGTQPGILEVWDGRRYRPLRGVVVAATEAGVQPLLRELIDRAGKNPVRCLPRDDGGSLTQAWIAIDVTGFHPGTHVGAELGGLVLALGLGRFDAASANQTEVRRLRYAEAFARATQRGIWADPSSPSPVARKSALEWAVHDALKCASPNSDPQVCVGIRRRMLPFLDGVDP